VKVASAASLRSMCCTAETNLTWCCISDLLVDALQMVIKCADIGHLAADLDTHKRWSYKLEEEFFRQVSHSTFTPVLSSFGAEHCAHVARTSSFTLRSESQSAVF